MTETTKQITVEDIARNQFDYLQEHPGVCADGNVNGWQWLRHYDGEWRVATFGGPHQLSSKVRGAVFSDGNALGWLISNPVTLIPAHDAGSYRHGVTSVWESADEQDVFTDRTRCFWCGVSERTRGLAAYQTTEQGVCHFCPGCHDSWERDGEIVGPIEAADEGTAEVNGS